MTGLDLFPDQFRHPFGYDRALLGADDYRGQSIRAPTSDTVSEVFAALGATTTDADPDRGRNAATSRRTHSRRDTSRRAT